MAASTAGTTPDMTAVPALDWDDIWEVGTNPRVRAAVTAQLYRYVSKKPHLDECQVARDHSYLPSGGSLWLSPNLFATATDAEQELALPTKPEHRLGPIWALDVTFDGVSMRVSPPRFGKPGGAWELTTTRRVPFGERHPLP